MLLVSESGASRKNMTKREQPSFWTFDPGVKGIIVTIHMPKNNFLRCIELRRSISAQRTFPSSYPSAFSRKESGQFGCR
jgi:hypothetical protein